jgi:hypothetical protein
VAYTPVNKQRLCKQQPLLGNARNNRTTGLCNPFLSNSSVNMPTIGILLETVFSIRSVQSSYKEEFSSESAVLDERPSIFIRDKSIFSSERLLHKDYYRRSSAEKNVWSWVSRGLTPRRNDWR